MDQFIFDRDRSRSIVKIKVSQKDECYKMKKGLICIGAVLLIVAMILIPREFMHHQKKDLPSAFTKQEASTLPREPVTEQVPIETQEPLEAVMVAKIQAQRVDSTHIKIIWSDELDALVTGYSIERYDNRTLTHNHTWISIGMQSIAEHVEGQSYEFVDALESADPQQYVYRVVPVIKDSNQYVAADGPMVLCSNWKICIDPGHYAGKNEVPGPDSYGYAEGDFTLKLALELRERLEKNYGITVCMTRDSESISIGGYTDESLDARHISLRGAYAAEQDCNLFISVHTNANEDNANGAATFQQPVSIDKPIIIANDLALTSEMLRTMCNQIGKNLAEVSFDRGISSHKDFTEITGKNAREWTTSYNDSTDEVGTVVCRYGNHGQYYGVLRGAQEAAVPGMIIEHGYHTVAEVRDAAQNGDLKIVWADADAQGIAVGLSFQELAEQNER